jgi:hypothetical protein
MKLKYNLGGYKSNGKLPCLEHGFLGSTPSNPIYSGCDDGSIPSVLINKEGMV